MTHRVGRRSGAQEVGHPARPPPRGPLAELDDILGWSRADDLRQREQPVGVGLRLDVVFDHPTAHAPTGQRHAHDRAHRDRGGHSVGNQIVERAIERGHVGPNPAHPSFSARSRPAVAHHGASAGRDGADVGQARDSAALRRESAWSVRSHVKSGSARPKWP